MSSGRYEFFDLQPSTADMLTEVVAGLTHQPKYITPKYFYDQRGSQLFEAITRLPEYYLTRTEIGLFDICLPEVLEQVGDGGCLVEYGAGSSLKIRRLLEVLRPAAYVPLDISRSHLERTAADLYADYPHLHIYPTCVDITKPFALPAVVAHEKKIGFFPGSSIGNIDPQGAAGFLRQVAATLGAGGWLLMGVDRKKDADLIEAAYNDSAGVTAEFNINILKHINSALAANFDPAAFSHLATYDAEAGCLQMHLKSQANQKLKIDGVEIEFRHGEAIHTENSYKYDHEQFVRLAESGGFRLQASWSDDDVYFTVFLLRVPTP